MSYLLVACGLKREAALIARPGVVVIAGGGDSARLEADLDRLAPGARAILSSGLAGALDPALRVGDVVVHGHLERTIPHAHPGLIVGQDSIAATAAEKAALFAATGALAVDMETHVAARVADRHGRSLAAIRVISDRADEDLPPAALVGMNPDGSTALGRVLWSLARQPGQFPALLRTGRMAAMAFSALNRAARSLDARDTGKPSQVVASLTQARESKLS